MTRPTSQDLLLALLALDAYNRGPQGSNVKFALEGDGGGEVRIHPIVARQVDPELLKKMGAAVERAVKS